MHSRTIILADNSEQTGSRNPDHSAQHRLTRLLFPGLLARTAAPVPAE